MKTWLWCCGMILFVLGCRTSSTENPADPAPRYASRINVARYDITQRQPSTAFTVYDESTAITRPFKIIAYLSHGAKPSDSAAMLNAIAWRARQLGADGMVVLQPEDTGFSVNQFGGGHRQPVYRANAFVFTDGVK